MSLNSQHQNWRVPALLGALTLFFYWRVLFTNRVMFPWDAAEYFYPALSFVHEELRHFRFPFWDPYISSGYPIIGDIEAQIFYPVNWLFVLIHPFSPLPYKIVEGQIILHFFLAGLFMYYLARSFVRNTLPALFSAVLFMCSGAMVAHTEHLVEIDTFALDPLVFLLARRALQKKDFFLTASAGIVFGIHALAGHWQHTVYLGFLLLLYFGYEACFGSARAELWPQWIYQLLMIAIAGAALAAVQIIPTAELGKLSVRSSLNYWDVTQGNEPNYLLTLFLPNFFGGLNGVPAKNGVDLSMYYVFLTVPGVLLAVLGLIETLRRRNFFYLGAILLFVALSLGNQGPLGTVLYHVPILNLFRNPGRYFDCADLLICLLAAVGAQSLFAESDWRPWKRYWPLGLALLVLAVTAAGSILQLSRKVQGWYHMLAVLAIFCAIGIAMLANKLSPQVSQYAVLAIVVFEFYFYNTNQQFNALPYDPRQYISFNSVLRRKPPLEFLHSDPATDFRVAAIAEFPLSGNGWNVWRIPTIYGWNQITLRRYDEYIRGFTKTKFPPMPGGFDGHNLASPMLDLLGTKYLLAVNQTPAEQSLRQSGKFELVFNDQDWWMIYRNKDYLSRTWFYPHAYVVPDQEQTVALASSGWFDARRTLLLEKGSLREAGARFAEELATITLGPSAIAAASEGQVWTDPQECAEALPAFGGWGAKDAWLRYDFDGPSQSGRYLILLKYTAAFEPAPELEIEVDNTGGKQQSGLVSLAGTTEWACYKSRTADLGAYQITPGANRLTIRSKVKSDLRLYSAWLVRLPPAPASDAGGFSFDAFTVSANRISFRSHLSRDGFVLLNEIYYPGWEATADGRPLEVIQADGILRAVFLPAGSHRLEFRFRPRYFAWGAAISILTLAVYLSYAGRARRQRKPGKTREKWRQWSERQ